MRRETRFGQPQVTCVDLRQRIRYLIHITGWTLIDAQLSRWSNAVFQVMVETQRNNRGSTTSVKEQLAETNLGSYTNRLYPYRLDLTREVRVWELVTMIQMEDCWLFTANDDVPRTKAVSRGDYPRPTYKRKGALSHAMVHNEHSSGQARNRWVA